MKSGVYSALVVAALALLLGSCSLFTTRTPEPPDNSGSQGWRFPSSAEIAISNLESAVGRRSSSDYVRAFAPVGSDLPSFEFIADQQTVAANPGRFDGWSYENEVNLAQALFSPANLPLDSLALFEMTIERQTTLGDTATIGCGYTLYLGHKFDHAPREMSGRAEFRILRSSDGGWYIQRWSDSRLTGSACWSDLKAAL